MENYETLLVEKKNKYVIITLNRPEKRNSLSLTLIAELRSLLAELKEDLDVYGLIITGAGTAFCSGADLAVDSDVKGNAMVFGRQQVLDAQQLMNEIEAFPHPVIAAVNGYALGGGCELALVCDLRIASEEAKFGLTEVTLGVTPCYGGTQRLPRLIGMANAKDMMFTGRRVPAAEAYEFGLVNKVVPADQLMAVAEAKMEEITGGAAPIAVSFVKDAINRGSQMPLSYALSMEADYVTLIKETEDVGEGIAAFFERRKPEFQNK